MNSVEATFSVQITWKFVGKVVLMISRSSLNMGHLRSKSRSQGLYIKNIVNIVQAAFSVQIS